MFLKPILAIIAFTFVIVDGHSQYGRTYMDQTSSNVTSSFPEFSGWHGGTQLNVASRQQFTGFAGRPQFYSVNGDIYFSKINSAVGVVVQNEILGSTQASMASLNYSYRIKLGSLYLLPSIGFTRHQIMWFANWLKKAPNYTRWHANQISGGFGWVYNKWFGAIHYGGSTDYNDPPQVYITGTNATIFTHQTAPIYNALFGRIIYLKQWSFYKSMHVQSNLSTMRVELNFNAAYHGFIAGIKFHVADYFALGIGYDILDRYRISYSTVLPVRRLISGSNRTHEIGLRILLNSKTEYRIIDNFGIF